jgi:hypothetical protein
LSGTGFHGYWSAKFYCAYELSYIFQSVPARSLLSQVSRRRELKYRLYYERGCRVQSITITNKAPFSEPEVVEFSGTEDV